MSKIVKNITGSPINISDTGVSIPATDQYLIPPQDYLIWAASDNIVTFVGSGDIVANDGSSDLSINDGIKLIQGLSPKDGRIVGNTDQTLIGNITDRLKVTDQDVLDVLTGISIGATPIPTVFKYGELAVPSRNEFDLTGTTHTVSTGKKLAIIAVIASYDAQAQLYVRLKKQTAGAGAFETVSRLTLMQGGQGDSTASINYGIGVYIGEATDVFKMTAESSVSKGTVWAGYSGLEY